MSDTWYRDPIPPYEDFAGRLWTIEGVCLNPAPEPEPVSMVDFESWIVRSIAQAAATQGLRRHDAQHFGYWPMEDGRMRDDRH